MKIRITNVSRGDENQPGNYYDALKVLRDAIGCNLAEAKHMLDEREVTIPPMREAYCHDVIQGLRDLGVIIIGQPQTGVLVPMWLLEERVLPILKMFKEFFPFDSGIGAAYAALGIDISKEPIGVVERMTIERLERAQGYQLARQLMDAREGDNKKKLREFMGPKVAK